MVVDHFLIQTSLQCKIICAFEETLVSDTMLNSCNFLLFLYQLRITFKMPNADRECSTKSGTINPFFKITWLKLWWYVTVDAHKVFLRVILKLVFLFWWYVCFNYLRFWFKSFLLDLTLLHFLIHSILQVHPIHCKQWHKFCLGLLLISKASCSSTRFILWFYSSSFHNRFGYEWFNCRCKSSFSNSFTDCCLGMVEATVFGRATVVIMLPIVLKTAMVTFCFYFFADFLVDLAFIISLRMNFKYLLQGNLSIVTLFSSDYNTIAFIL